MQIKSLRTIAYRSWAVDDTTPPEAIERLKKIEQYRQMRAQGLSEDLALDFIGWSRAKYYRLQRCLKQQGLKGLVDQSRRPHQVRQRQWSRQQEQQVLALRRQHPAWGKKTLCHILTRDHGLNLSESTVGRILSKAIRLNRIKPCAFYSGRVKVKRSRDFSQHAQRWRYREHRHKDQPGQLVQIDHMSVYLTEGKSFKEFRAICPVTRRMAARVYSRATARNAKSFLNAVLKTISVHSIQVDGGSEFRGEFEQACADRDIPLMVLPPKRPQYNGCVERANRTVRQEFYPFYAGEPTVAGLNEGLAEYLKCYNEYRPHQALDSMTPNEYFQQWVAA